MKQLRLNYFTKQEIFLWIFSTSMILLSFKHFDGENTLTLYASIIGVTSLLFNAKGHPFGQLLMIIFSLLYGFISYQFDYYGEMITYLGMTGPMAFVALIAWIKNPFNENKSQVKIDHLHSREWGIMFALALLVTFIFYFILEYFNTSHLYLSTFSVTTSFIAVYLTYKRSEYFALAYAMNDIVLIGLWILASKNDQSVLSVVVCFSMFLINDCYGFVNWRKLKSQQASLMNLN